MDIALTAAAAILAQVVFVVAMLRRPTPEPRRVPVEARVDRRAPQHRR